MGWFSTKKKTYVASSVYNLAGEEESRPAIIKSLALRTVLSPKGNFAENLRATLLNGTAMSRRNFYRYAKRNYPRMVPNAAVGYDRELDADDVQTQLETLLEIEENESLVVLAARIDDLLIEYWAEAWLVENSSGSASWDWAYDLNSNRTRVEMEAIHPVTGVLVTVSFPTPDEFTAHSAVANARLIYVSYFKVITDEDGTVRVSPPALYTYRRGQTQTVSEFEDLFDEPHTGFEEFFPTLRLRENKQWIFAKNGNKFNFDAPNGNIGVNEAELTRTKKLYMRAFGGKMNQLFDSLDEADGVGDIDNIYLTFGVSLNAKDQISLRYIWEFLDLLSAQGVGSLSSYQSYINEVSQLNEQAIYLDRWLIANKPEASKSHPLHGLQIPQMPRLTKANRSAGSVSISAEDFKQFSQRISWDYTHKIRRVGRVTKAAFGLDVKPGEFGSIDGEPVALEGDTSPLAFMNPFFRSFAQNPVWYIYRQVDRTHYERIEVRNFRHENHVTGGKSVVLNSLEAMADSEESGFLLPLHYPSLRRMGLVQEEQLTRVSSFLVLNSYKTVKIKWYQRGIFKVILAIVLVVAVSFFFPGGLAAMPGILGANAAVGMAIGASGMAAAIAGAVINAIAATVLTTLISSASVAIFGEKWGAIIGTIISMVAFNMANSFVATGSFSFDITSIMRAENILSLTSTAANAYTSWVNADTAAIYEEMQKQRENYEVDYEAIKDKAAEILGMTGDQIGPILMTDALEQFGELPESFLSRTLLTGSDIVELTLAMVSDFADLSLELPNGA